MDVKKINIGEPVKNNKQIKAKPKKKRVITQNNNWTEACNELETLDETNMETLIQNDRLSPLSKLLLKQIKSKICGYAGQDRDKKLFHEELFVNLQDVLQLFKTSEMI